jgi:glyoxylase I family protein
MRAAGVHHVSLNVSDVASAKAFYVDVLGLTERTDRPDFGFGGAWLDVGSQQIHLIEGDVPEAKGQHVALAVDDLEAVIAELRERGIKVSKSVVVGTGLQSFLRDPCGNMVELNQPGGALQPT